MVDSVDLWGSVTAQVYHWSAQVVMGNVGRLCCNKTLFIITGCRLDAARRLGCQNADLEQPTESCCTVCFGKHLEVSALIHPTHISC